ncbi:MAG: glycerate kinase [Holdemania massiliensis]
MQLDEQLKQADLIITGEGRLDSQSLQESPVSPAAWPASSRSGTGCMRTAGIPQSRLD